jgi:hypothetical protein
MTDQYEETKAPRFVVESVDGNEQIVIPARRNLFVMFFLLCWLGGWTFGGVMAITTLWSKGFQPFLVFWLGGWALGEAYVGMTLCWQFFGAEIIRVPGSDLEINNRMLGFTRKKLFRGNEIRDLSSHTPLAFGQTNQMPLPFLISNKTGSVKFTYGARTIFVAAGLDEAEGRLIVDRLRKRLPSTAMA